MSDKKISALTAATTPLAGSEVLPIVQGGTTKKVAVSDVAALATVNLTGPITSVGAATSIASQTGTGSTFVMSASPTLTGTIGAAALTLTTPLGVSSGGTGLATLTSAAVLLGNGTSTVNFVSPSSSGNVLTSNGTAWTSATPAGGGATISNDTSTATDIFPLFASATSGVPATIFTSNARLLYKPSTGDLQSSQMIALNGLMLNATTVATSYTIAAGYNASSVGPITLGTGITVTITSGQRWVVL